MSTSTLSDGYALGYDTDIVGKLNQRSGIREGAFVMPHLQKGMRMLDVGCGPGSITLEFSQLLAPGIVTGVDVNEEQIIQASQNANNKQIKNVQFQTGSVYQLPFENETFDVVFAHTLFMHLSDPQSALKEVHRVCKKGGLIAIREGLGSFEYFSNTQDAIAGDSLGSLLSKVTKLSGGEPDIGIRLKGYLSASGFKNIVITPYSEIYDSREDMELIKNWYQSLLRGRVGEIAVENKLLSGSGLNDLIDGMEQWPADENAINVVAWIEYLARKI